jgi:coat protein Gp5
MTTNTLTGLVLDVQKSADRVLREQQGFIGAVFMDPSAEMVAKDQNITYEIVPTIAAADVTPAAVPTDPTGVTVGYGQMTIDKVKKASFAWNGEEQASISSIYNNVKQDQFSQAIRTLTNLVEYDLFIAAKNAASRAYGAAGTTPFGTAGELDDIAQIRKILADNGAWTSDMHMVLNSSSGAEIRGAQSSLFKVNEAGSSDLLRNGTLGRLQGFDFHESGKIALHTKGTGASYQIDGAVAIGVEDVVLDVGTGTVLPGDVAVVTDEALGSKYIVGTGIAAPGTISLNKPGAVATFADNKAVTLGANYTGNFAFERNAIHLLTRLPKLPEEGALGEHIVITDPYSGISFLLSIYAAYHKVIIEISLAWGVKAVKSEAIATLLG